VAEAACLLPSTYGPAERGKGSIHPLRARAATHPLQGRKSCLSGQIQSSDMNKDWVKLNLAHLRVELSRALPLELTTEFTPSASLYDALFRATDFTFLLRQLCEHVHIPTVPQVEVVGDSDVPLLDLQAGLKFSKKEIHSAGQYRSDTSLSSKITVGASYLRRPRAFCGICAHELAHHLLRSKSIMALSEHEGEMLTDLVAVYMGFGKLMLNGAVDTGTAYAQEPIHLAAKGVAYLGYPLLSYAYYLCQTMRGPGEEDMYGSLEGPCVDHVRAFSYHHGRGVNHCCERKTRWWAVALYYLVGIGPSPAPSPPALPETDGTASYQGAWRLDMNRYKMVACPQCGARLKIPKSDKRLEVTCPNCRRVFLVAYRY